MTSQLVPVTVAARVVLPHTTVTGRPACAASSVPEMTTEALASVALILSSPAIQPAIVGGGGIDVSTRRIALNAGLRLPARSDATTDTPVVLMSPSLPPGSEPLAGAEPRSIV